MFVKQTSEKSLVIGTPAKLNLDLKVLGKREDGYHDIDSLFQAVSLFDRLTISRDDNLDGVAMSLTGADDLLTDESNLVTRSFRLLQKEFRLKGGLRVELEKNIPVAAGLGGGSADGAATILATRILFDLPLNFDQMAGFGAKIGSDFPFFFSSGQARVTGRGEIVEPIELPTDYWLILVTPDIAISTAEAYCQLKMPLTKHDPARSIRGWKSPADFVKWLSDTGNDFEKIQLAAFPELEQVKYELLKSGALLSRMSGSGPTVYGIFEITPETEGDRAFGKSNWDTSIVRPIRLPARL